MDYECVKWAADLIDARAKLVECLGRIEDRRTEDDDLVHLMVEIRICKLPKRGIVRLIKAQIAEIDAQLAAHGIHHPDAGPNNPHRAEA